MANIYTPPQNWKISTRSVSEKAWLNGFRRATDGYTAWMVLHQSLVFQAYHTFSFTSG
jgi:hypothetical protein